MTAIEIIGSALSGGAVIKLIEYLFLRNKSKAETHKIEIETDGLVSDQWRSLFEQVSKEWQQAKATIAQNVADIISLRRALDEEKIDCAEKMQVLKQEINQLKKLS